MPTDESSDVVVFSYYVRALEPVARCVSCRVKCLHVRVVGCPRVDSVVVVVDSVDGASSRDDGGVIRGGTLRKCHLAIP